MSIELTCFWLFSQVLLLCIREEVFFDIVKETPRKKLY